MANPSRKITGPVRDLSPCYGCKRPWKKPGCHDTCKDFGTWQAKIGHVKQAREDYQNKTFNRVGCMKEGK